MLFEHYPVLLVPIIILTVEGWNAAKVAARHVRQSRQAHRSQGPGPF